MRLNRISYMLEDVDARLFQRRYRVGGSSEMLDFVGLLEFNIVVKHR